MQLINRAMPLFKRTIPQAEDAKQMQDNSLPKIASHLTGQAFAEDAKQMQDNASELSCLVECANCPGHP